MHSHISGHGRRLHRKWKHSTCLWLSQISISYVLCPLKALDQTQPRLKQERVCAPLDNIPRLPKRLHASSHRSNKQRTKLPKIFCQILVTELAISVELNAHGDGKGTVFLVLQNSHSRSKPPLTRLLKQMWEVTKVLRLGSRGHLFCRHPLLSTVQSHLPLCNHYAKAHD